MLDSKKMNALAAVKSENAVSIYIPTHRVDGIQEDRINYKNALSEAAEKLLANGLTETTARQLLSGAEEKLNDDDFWRDQSDALAVYIYNDRTEFFSLPIDTTPQVWLSDKLYLLPAVPLMTERKGFYLLALSLNEVKVYEGSEFTLAELVKNESFPEDLAEILKTYDPNSTLQHSAGSGDNSVYHGQGAGKDIENIRYEEYLRKVEEGIQAMVCDDDKQPLVLYTTPSLAGIYRKVNNYPHLIEDYIEGNPEQEDMMTLHEKSWILLDDRFLQEEKDQLETFNQDLADNKAAFNLLTIAPAAFAGQIETLYLAKGTEMWGKYNPTTHSVEIHSEKQADSQPLHNDIALAVHQQGGDVYIMDRNQLPRPTANANAQLRYEVFTA